MAWMYQFSHGLIYQLNTFSESSSFHDPIIKSVGSFFIPRILSVPFTPAPPPLFTDPLTSDCSFKNVGDES